MLTSELEDYIFTKELAKTKIGTSYLCIHTPTKRVVVIKKLNPSVKSIYKQLIWEQLIKNKNSEFIKTEKIFIKNQNGSFEIFEEDFIEKEKLKELEKNDCYVFKKEKCFFEESSEDFPMFNFTENRIKKSNQVLISELTNLREMEVFFVKEVIDRGSVLSLLKSGITLEPDLIIFIVHSILLLLRTLNKKRLFLKNMNNRSILIDKRGVIFSNYYLKEKKIFDLRCSTSNMDTSYFFVASDENNCKSDIFSLGIMILEMVYGNFNLLISDDLKEIDDIVDSSSLQYKEQKEFYPIGTDVIIKDLKEDFKEIARRYTKGNTCIECKESLVPKINSKCCKSVMNDVTNTRTIKMRRDIPSLLMEFITICLCDESEKRPTAKDLLKHPLFYKIGEIDLDDLLEKLPEIKIEESVVEKIIRDNRNNAAMEIEEAIKKLNLKEDSVNYKGE